jgi:hypothetical protein
MGTPSGMFELRSALLGEGPPGRSAGRSPRLRSCRTSRVAQVPLVLRRADVPGWQLDSGRATDRRPSNGPVGSVRAMDHRATGQVRQVNQRDRHRFRVRPADGQRHRHGLRHRDLGRSSRFGEVTALALDEVLYARSGPYRTPTFSTQLVDIQRCQRLGRRGGQEGRGTQSLGGEPGARRGWARSASLRSTCRPPTSPCSTPPFEIPHAVQVADPFHVVAVRYLPDRPVPSAGPTRAAQPPRQKG